MAPGGLLVLRARHGQQHITGEGTPYLPLFDMLFIERGEAGRGATLHTPTGSSPGLFTGEDNTIDMLVALKTLVNSFPGCIMRTRN
jgi:hypothetical protein